MLQFKTIERNTLDLLKQLMSIEELNDFVLVGGTCLALQYGHRKSIDFDLFSLTNFNVQDLQNLIISKFENIQITGSPKFGLFAYINTIKVDFINYGFYKLLKPVINIEGIRMVSPEDIAAMKIFALLQRGKKKDFWDISLLLDEFGVENIINFYTEKYPNNRTLISIPRCLVYFDDAEDSEDPDCLKGFSWESVKKNIRKHVNHYLK